MALVTFELTLESAKQLTPSVYQLAFRMPAGEPMEFIPGQFINLYFEHEEKRHSRSYSIASIPHSSNQMTSYQSPLVEVAISHIPGGLASESLKNLAPGQAQTAAGPVGRLVLKDEEKPKRYILVGTGTGIAPYRAMIPVLEKRLNEDQELEVMILFGIRNPTERFYTDDFEALAARNPRARFYTCYSQEVVKDPSPYEWNGRVTHYLKELTFDPANDIVYLCGNPAMIDDAFVLLQEAGFDHKNVKREKYVFSHR